MYTPYAVSFVLELTDTKDHVFSVINTKLRSVSSQDWKQQSAVLTTKVKGKIFSLLALLTANTNSNVRKTYPVAVHGKTLSLICSLALKVASGWTCITSSRLNSIRHLTVLVFTWYSLTNCQLHIISFLFESLLTSHFFHFGKKVFAGIKWFQQMLSREIRSEARMNELIDGLQANMSRQ